MPPDPDALRQVATQTGGALLPGADRARPRARLQGPDVAARHDAQGRGGHGRVRGRRRAAAARERRALRALVQAGAVIRAALLAAAAIVRRARRGTSPRAARPASASGLKVCIPVEGPWVVIPPVRTAVLDARAGGSSARAAWSAASTRSRARQRLRWSFPGLHRQPRQPRHHDGDARSSSGAPTPGGARTGRRATSRSSAASRAAAAARARRWRSRARAPSSRASRSRRASRTLVVELGRLARATLACKPGERLLGGTHSIGLYLMAEPTREATGEPCAWSSSQARPNRLLVSATRRGLDPHLRAEVQVLAECAR